MMAFLKESVEVFFFALKKTSALAWFGLGVAITSACFQLLPNRVRSWTKQVGDYEVNVYATTTEKRNPWREPGRPEDRSRPGFFLRDRKSGDRFLIELRGDSVVLVHHQRWPGEIIETRMNFQD